MPLTNSADSNSDPGSVIAWITFTQCVPTESVDNIHITSAASNGHRQEATRKEIFMVQTLKHDHCILLICHDISRPSSNEL